MESKTKQSSFLKIERDKYWNIVYSFLKEKTKQQYGSFDNWFESDNGFTYSYLVDHKLGIRICENDEELPEDDNDYSCFYFYIVDQKKCLWAKLKYGI
jgi:hypothetical protein